MILVTGATGLLGAHILHRLLQDHEQVVAIKRPTSSLDGVREIFSYYRQAGSQESGVGSRESGVTSPDSSLQSPVSRLPSPDSIIWRDADMLDKPSLIRALEGIDTVINCAAIVSFDPRDRKRLIRNNVEGTRNLGEAVGEVGEVEKVEKVENDKNDKRGETSERGEMSGIPSRGVRLIHISSTSALGDAPGRDAKFRVDEETPRDPNRKHSGYSESKYLSEQVLLDYYKTLDIRHSTLDILNPGIILGPGQWTKGSSQLFVKAYEGLKVYPYGGTGYVDVRDVADVAAMFCKPKTDSGSQFKVYSLRLPPVRKPKTVNRKPSLDIRHSTLDSGLNRFCLVGANLRYKEFFDKVTDAYGLPNPQIYAGRFLTEVAWRLDTLRARLTGRFPLITRETAESAQRISFYSSEKITRETGFTFRDIDDTIYWCVDSYKRSLAGR